MTNRLDVLSDIPPTEPQRPAPTPKPRQRAAQAATQAGSGASVIAPDAIVPELSREATEPAFWYWCGAVSGCSFESPAVAGIGFPKACEELLPNGPGNPPRREARKGCVVALTVSQLRLLAKRLRYSAVRFTGEVWPSGLPGATLVDYPTPEDIELARLRPDGIFLHQAKPNAATDRPLADYLFLVPIEQAEKPTERVLATADPEPLSRTGIILPTDATPVAQVPARNGKVIAAR